MFAKRNRLSKKEFSTTFDQGRKIHSPKFLAVVLITKKDEEKKFSVVVSKKVGKTAVERNKLRRRGYSLLSKHSKKIKKGLHILLFFKKEAQKLSFKETEDEIITLLQKSNMYETNNS